VDGAHEREQFDFDHARLQAIGHPRGLLVSDVIVPIVPGPVDHQRRRGFRCGPGERAADEVLAALRGAGAIGG
jgi:hypothetical protein